MPLFENFAGEVASAAKIVQTFRDHTNFGIPAHIIRDAKGLAILHVTKAGLLVSAEHGNGIVVARLPDGSWSAPAAIKTTALGVGHQLGVEVSNLIFVLNTDDAVKAFAKGHNFSVGGQVSFAIGPLGRAAEVAGTIKSFAPIYTYSHSKGLFAGASVELSSISERSSVNADTYGAGVSSEVILSGGVPPPDFAADLYLALGAAIVEVEVTE
ncbi:SH3 domain-containing YSC84-like protein 1, partial [Physocladia obscura]